MPNKCSILINEIKIKPAEMILRQCKTLYKILEIVQSMPDPTLSLDISKHNEILIIAKNKNGVCIYTYKNNEANLTSEDYRYLIELQSIKDLL